MFSDAEIDLYKNVNNWKLYKTNWQSVCLNVWLSNTLSYSCKCRGKLRVQESLKDLVLDRMIKRKV